MKTNKSAMIIALAAIALAAVLPMFITNNYHLNLMIQVLINIIIVVGLNFITGLTGQMNLGTAGIFSMGAYTSSLLATKLGLNPWICLVAAVGMGCLIGMGLGYPSQRVSGVYLALTTIGFSEIVRILMTNLTGLTGGALGVTGIPTFSIFGFKFQSNKEIYYLYLVIAVLLIFNDTGLSIPSGGVPSLLSRIIRMRWRQAACIHTMWASSTQAPTTWNFQLTTWSCWSSAALVPCRAMYWAQSWLPWYLNSCGSWRIITGWYSPSLPCCSSFSCQTGLFPCSGLRSRQKKQ